MLLFIPLGFIVLGAIIGALVPPGYSGRAENAGFGILASIVPVAFSALIILTTASTPVVVGTESLVQIDENTYAVVGQGDKTTFQTEGFNYTTESNVERFNYEGDPYVEETTYCGQMLPFWTLCDIGEGAPYRIYAPLDMIKVAG